MICLEVLERRRRGRVRTRHGAATAHPGTQMPPPDSAVEPPNCGGLLDDQGVQAVGLGGQRRGHAAAAGADHQDVDDVVEVVAGSSRMPAPPFGSRTRRSAPAQAGSTAARLDTALRLPARRKPPPRCGLRARSCRPARRSSRWPRRRCRPAGWCPAVPGRRGPSRGSAAAAGSRPVGEVVGRRDHRGLPSRALFGAHRRAVRRCAPARPAARSPGWARADRGTAHRIRPPAPACPVSPGNSPTAVPRARTRRMAPAGWPRS